MDAANSTRARGIQIEDYFWGRIVKGTREMLIQHGYTLDGIFPGDPGARKTVERRTDPAGRVIAIQRKSKYIFAIRRDWNEDERKAYMAKPANIAERIKSNLILLDFKPYGILDDLEQLREMVESGEINGLVFAAKYTNPGERRHFFGASGRYAENIDEALGATAMLQRDLLRM